VIFTVVSHILDFGLHVHLMIGYFFEGCDTALERDTGLRDFPECWHAQFQVFADTRSEAHNTVASHALENYWIAYRYLLSVLVVGTLMSLLAANDSTLKHLRWFCRLPICMFLGFFQLVFPLKMVQAYQSGKMTDPARMAKLLQGGFEAAPLATMQLYELAVNTGGWRAWRRWLSVLASIHSVGQAFAEADVADTSVFSESARTTAWKMILAFFRATEAGARIAGVVALEIFFGNWHLGYLMVIVDLTIGTCLALCMGACRECIAAMLFAGMSMFVNHHLNDRNEEYRRVGDVLQWIRGFEFLTLAGGVLYSWKFNRALAARLWGHHEVVAVFLGCLACYLLVLNVVLMVRQKHAPERLLDDASDSDGDDRRQLA